MHCYPTHQCICVREDAQHLHTISVALFELISLTWSQRRAEEQKSVCYTPKETTMLLFTFFLRCSHNCCCNSVCAFENASRWWVNICLERKSPFEHVRMNWSLIPQYSFCLLTRVGQIPQCVNMELSDWALIQDYLLLYVSCSVAFAIYEKYEEFSNKELQFLV